MKKESKTQTGKKSPAMSQAMYKQHEQAEHKMEGKGKKKGCK